MILALLLEFLSVFSYNTQFCIELALLVNTAQLSWLLILDSLICCCLLHTTFLSLSRGCESHASLTLQIWISHH